MELPDAVLTFKLLNTAGLNLKDRQLALTACPNVSFTNMKSALKRIFGDAISWREGKGALPVNADSDCAYYTRYSCERENKSKSSQLQIVAHSTNPFDKRGRNMRCAVCQSIFHWAKDCPNKKKMLNWPRIKSKRVNIKNVILHCFKMKLCLMQKFLWWKLWGQQWLTQPAQEQCVEKNGWRITQVDCHKQSHSE